MSPDSLIFVVVLLIWATYLSLHVARRREQLSTARSVDRFSAHMRVLQRRSVKAVPRSAPVTSSGPARTSILAAGALEGAGAVAPAAQETAQPVRREPVRTALRQAPPVAQARRGARSGAVHSSRAFAAWGAFTGALGRLDSRRLRAYALLISLVAGVVMFALAALGRASWALPVAAASMTFGLLAWLRRDRRAVLAARARRETARRLAAERDLVAAERVAAEDAARVAAATAAARPEVAPLPVAQEHVTPRARAPFDVALFEPAVSAPAVPTVDPLVAEHAWEPVPVPRPTYTIKARAEHPLPPALRAPVPIDVIDDVEEAFWAADAKAVGH